MKLINVGYANFVSAARVIALIAPEAAPVKSLIEGARAEGGGKLIDATYGRRLRAVLVMDNDSVILSAVQPETIAARFALKDGDLALDAAEDAPP